jgi:hypothetical protein
MVIPDAGCGDVHKSQNDAKEREGADGEDKKHLLGSGHGFLP